MDVSTVLHRLELLRSAAPDPHVREERKRFAEEILLHCNLVPCPSSLSLFLSFSLPLPLFFLLLGLS
jgi:hypothetical protein